MGGGFEKSGYTDVNVRNGVWHVELFADMSYRGAYPFWHAFVIELGCR